ncbi:hypothetical protein K523DRAFT_336571 [Schizophyllum commune Tattone D]|nr:hypothetical protein K523DRAFT_336571 [Schizophyllum commune Tattone D]
MTPECSTGIYRSPQLRQKVLDMAGLTCLLFGLLPECTLNVAHWLPRCLEFKYPEKYARLVAAIGSIVVDSNGNMHRVLHLDSSGNQDVLCGTGHLAFDGTKGLGSGVISPVPITVKEDMKRIARNPQMSARQWFPETSSLFRIHAYHGERLPITIVGPRLRLYDHVKPKSAQELEAEDRALAELCSEPAFSATIEPEDISEECRRVTETMTSKSEEVNTHIVDSQKPESLNWLVRSHINKTYAYADIGYKLMYRRDKVPGGLQGADLDLYHELWPTIGYWFEDVDTPQGEDKKIPVQVADYISKLRRSGRLAKARTDEALKQAPMSPAPKLKVAASAPTVLPCEDLSSSSRAAKRKRNVEPVPAPSSAPRRGQPSSEEESAPPAKKKRRILNHAHVDKDHAA